MMGLSAKETSQVSSDAEEIAQSKNYAFAY